MYTYNQIVQINKDFWTTHRQVQSHYHDEEVKPTNIKYISVFSNGKDVIVNGTQVTFPFEITIIDRPNLKNKTQNDIEIKSDTTSIALDYIAYFNNTKFPQALQIELSTTIVQIQGGEEDNVTGVRFTINLNTIVNYALCLLPVLSYPVPSGYEQRYGSTAKFDVNAIYATIVAPETNSSIGLILPGIHGIINTIIHQAPSAPEVSFATLSSGTYVPNIINIITFTYVGITGSYTGITDVTYTITQL